MITGRGERVGKAGKHGFAIVRNGADFAVHDLGAAHHAAAKRLADGLVPKTDAQDGHLSSKTPDESDADSGLRGRLRTWGDHHAFRRQALNLIQRNLIIAAYLDGGAKLTQILNEVVSER